MIWENLAPQFLYDDKVADFADKHDLRGWESWFAPYEREVYEFVLERLQPEDVVLDIGAGDFRFALAAAKRAQRVYAVEVYPPLVTDFLARHGADLPRNLQVVCANAIDLPFPADATVGVLLMRHCQHFGLFFHKLQAVGARRLFSNARWKSGVEEIDLLAPRQPVDRVPPGWYACACGAVGFKAPPHPEDDWEEAIHEVSSCPQCQTQGAAP